MGSVGYEMTQLWADKIFAQTGARRDDVGVVELHVCCSADKVCTGT